MEVAELDDLKAVERGGQVGIVTSHSRSASGTTRCREAATARSCGRRRSMPRVRSERVRSIGPGRAGDSRGPRVGVPARATRAARRLLPRTGTEARSSKRPGPGPPGLSKMLPAARTRRESQKPANRIVRTRSSIGSRYPRPLTTLITRTKWQRWPSAAGTTSARMTGQGQSGIMMRCLDRLGIGRCGTRGRWATAPSTEG